MVVLCCTSAMIRVTDGMSVFPTTKGGDWNLSLIKSWMMLDKSERKDKENPSVEKTENPPQHNSGRCIWTAGCSSIGLPDVSRQKFRHTYANFFPLRHLWQAPFICIDRKRMTGINKTASKWSNFPSYKRMFLLFILIYPHFHPSTLFSNKIFHKWKKHAKENFVSEMKSGMDKISTCQ